MSIKLNFWRRAIINSIYILAILIMFGIPAFFGIKEIYNNIEFTEGNKIGLNWAISGVLIMSVFGILYIRYFRKWLHRKLIGLQVRDELGIMPVKGFLGIITDRILKTLEYIYPFLITLIMLYVSKYSFSQFIVFEKLYDMNIILLYLSFAGFGVFLVGDFIKVEMMKKQEIINRLALESRANKLELKRLRKNDKRQLKALELERQLKILKDS